VRPQDDHASDYATLIGPTSYCDYEHHVNYIHFNPVKHGYVDRAVDWEYSSIHRYISNGIIPENWGVSSELDFVGGFGEKL
jgi:putative transposase